MDSNKYYVLVGIAEYSFKFLCGSVDRLHIEDRLADYLARNVDAPYPVRRLSICTLPNDKQTTINATIQALNIHADN